MSADFHASRTDESPRRVSWGAATVGNVILMTGQGVIIQYIFFMYVVFTTPNIYIYGL